MADIRREGEADRGEGGESARDRKKSASARKREGWREGKTEAGSVNATIS